MSPTAHASNQVREVSVANRHPRLRFNRQDVIQLISLLDANVSTLGRSKSGIPAGELSIVFLTDEAIARLHGAFLYDPTTTDVITFEGNPALGTAGEICISADTARAYAKAHGHKFSTELALYVIHGWLHLAGHDDLVPAKKRVMRRAEARALQLLERADAMPWFVFREKRIGS
jgi:probable rRNA maturation factor